MLVIGCMPCHNLGGQAGKGEILTVEIFNLKWLSGVTSEVSSSWPVER